MSTPIGGSPIRVVETVTIKLQGGQLIRIRPDRLILKITRRKTDSGKYAYLEVGKSDIVEVLK